MNLPGLSGTFGSLLETLGSSQIGGHLIQALGPKVVQDVLDQLNENGLGAQVNSWLGKGQNMPLTADEVRAALGNEQVRQLAASLGIPADKLAEVLATHLPTGVDQASKDGTLPASH